jgi:hypothetical protein
VFVRRGAKHETAEQSHFPQNPATFLTRPCASRLGSVLNPVTP